VYFTSLKMITWLAKTCRRSLCVSIKFSIFFSFLLCIFSVYLSAFVGTTVLYILVHVYEARTSIRCLYVTFPRKLLSSCVSCLLIESKPQCYWRPRQAYRSGYLWTDHIRVWNVVEWRKKTHTLQLNYVFTNIYIMSNSANWRIRKVQVVINGPLLLTLFRASLTHLKRIILKT
jgi:hypothetical protein